MNDDSERRGRINIKGTQNTFKFSIIYFPYNNSRYTDIILQSMIHILYKYLFAALLNYLDAPREFSTTYLFVSFFLYGDISLSFARTI